MKTILLMRHAEAVEAVSDEADFDRRLTAAGISMAWQTGLLLRAQGLAPQRILASAAVRTVQTAFLVRQAVAGFARPEVSVQPEFGPGVPVQLQSGLYGGSAESFADAARYEAAADESSVLVVGHNPGMAMLMCGWGLSVLSVPPATLAVFRFDVNDWLAAGRSGCQGELILLIRNGRLDPGHGSPVVAG